MKKFRKVITLALAFTLAFSLICSQKAFAAEPSYVDLEFSVVAKIKQADGSYKVYYPGYDLVYNRAFDFQDNDIDAALASIEVNLLDNDEKAKIFAWFKENGIDINNANESEFFTIDNKTDQAKANAKTLYYSVSNDSLLNDTSGLTEEKDYYVRFVTFLEAVGTYEAVAPAQNNGSTTTSDKLNIAELNEQEAKTAKDKVIVAVGGENGYSLFTYDITLVNEQGVAYTKENFPAGGVDVVIPYPKGMNKSNYKYRLFHFANGVNGDATEIKPLELTDKGIKFHANSLSPFVLTVQKADTTKSPKAGESNAFVLSMLGIIAVAGMGLYVGKKQEN